MVVEHIFRLRDRYINQQTQLGWVTLHAPQCWYFYQALNHSNGLNWSSEVGGYAMDIYAAYAIYLWTATHNSAKLHASLKMEYEYGSYLRYQ